MEENKERITSLFIKLTERKCTQEERLELLAWLQENPLPEYLPAVEDLLQQQPWPAMPADTAGQIFTAILQHTPSKPVIPLWKRTGFRVAAALVPLIGLATLLLFFYRDKNDKRHFVNNTRQVQTFRLEDGTVISLNQRSSLTVNTSPHKNRPREAWLKGEAFFTVIHQAANPFVVHTGNGVDVNVLGTAFNVNTANGHAVVVLNEGRVKINTGAGHALTLNPGEMASYNADTKMLTRQKVDTLFQTSWKYNLLAFKEEPLKIVMQKLGEQYDYEIVFDQEGTGELLFTGYLPSDNLQQAIITIEQSFNLKFILQHKTIRVNNKKIL
ncbi:MULTISPECIES: FecR family protein [unclassified Chitinophaga]|uniref:FecR family protein n=1 Tax=unclassified Chitinophaga TaxID=2619133 RepID=UPI00301044BD